MISSNPVFSGQTSPAIPAKKHKKPKYNQTAEPTSENAASPQLDKESSKEALFLPHTGIELPFLKKKINFIKDAPDYEPVLPNGSNFRFLMAVNSTL
jgi:hypothetical protein